MGNFFLPAVGERVASDGALRTQGTVGAYVYSTFVATLGYFNSTVSNPATPSGENRAHGHTIRCVR